MMEIIFAGGSHYGIKGYFSLCDFFEKIYILDGSVENIASFKREQDEIVDSFDSAECDFVFLCGYGRLITKEELSKKKYINVHGALLPKYRGMHSTFFAIMNGEEKLGITYHLVDEGMDSGDIIAQYSFEYNRQTVGEINRLIDDLVGETAGKVCADFLQGRITPTKQKPEEITFGARRNLDDCLVDYEMNCEYMDRFFCALTDPYPRPMIMKNGIRYEVLDDYEIMYRNYYGPIGRVVNIDDRGAWIKIKDGFLIVCRLRKYGTSEVIEANKLFRIGSRL